MSCFGEYFNKKVERGTDRNLSVLHHNIFTTFGGNESICLNRWGWIAAVVNLGSVILVPSHIRPDEKIQAASNGGLQSLDQAPNTNAAVRRHRPKKHSQSSAREVRAAPSLELADLNPSIRFPSILPQMIWISRQFRVLFPEMARWVSTLRAGERKRTALRF